MLGEIVTSALTPPDRTTLALALFDGATVAYHLPPRHRHLLDLAAQYYDQAKQRGERPARIGRDMALAAASDGLADEDRCLVASIVAFQSDRIKRDQELAFLRLDDHDRHAALRLSAMLALADGLAANGASIQIKHDHADEITLIVNGERAAHAAEAVAERDWRWFETLGPLTVRTAAPDEPIVPLSVAPGVALAPLAEPEATPPGGEDLAESARRLLRRHFEKMLARESNVRSGEDSEDVHQMRVATRRLRASLQVIAPVFDLAAIKRFRGKLSFVADTLGHVRDADVFLEHVRAYRETLSAPRRAALDQLLERVVGERASARADLLAALDSKRYQKFKHAFARFLTTPHAGVVLRADHGGPLLLRDMAGSLIWRRYEGLRSFGAVLTGASDEQIHQARIAGKRLRYTLEFFAEALGDGVDGCLKPLADLQETLGGLQDSVVARERIAGFGLANTPGPRAYIARREVEHTRLLRSIPAHWARVDRPAYRRRLFELISAL